MKRFRIGNDIQVQWTVKKNGEEVDLENKVVSVYLCHPRGRTAVKKFEVSGALLSFTFSGTEQTTLGPYSITIDVRNDDGTRHLIKDACGAFCLVGRSCIENEEDYKVTL